VKIDALKNFQHPKVKEVWWARLGMNIGREVYGKGRDYTRPVLVINSEGSEMCIIVPLTSKLRKNKYTEVVTTEDGKKHCAMLYQTRAIDKRRLREHVYTLNDAEYSKVEAVFTQTMWSWID
jgi:mRNA interferase MazF